MTPLSDPKAEKIRKQAIKEIAANLEEGKGRGGTTPRGSKSKGKQWKDKPAPPGDVSTVTVSSGGRSATVTEEQFSAACDQLGKEAEAKHGGDLRRIRKVKGFPRLPGGKIEIVYETGSLGNPDEYSLKCSEAPRPALEKAMAALSEHVIDLCELPEHWIDTITIKGVSFSYGGDNGVMGAVVTFTQPLRSANSPLVINTPHQSEEPYSETGDVDVCMTEEYAEALRQVQWEALAYIDGKRAQMTLQEAAEDAA